MQDLLTHINGLDMALGLAILILHIWRTPEEGDESAEVLDTKAAD